MIVPDTIIPQLNIRWTALPSRRRHTSEARAAWHEYYRCVRILRAMRADDRDRFKRFSSAWWQGSYRWECETPKMTVHAQLVIRKVAASIRDDITPEARDALRGALLAYKRDRGYP